jgi:hypothetical protein
MYLIYAVPLPQTWSHLPTQYKSATHTPNDTSDPNDNHTSQHVSRRCKSPLFFKLFKTIFIISSLNLFSVKNLICKLLQLQQFADVAKKVAAFKKQPEESIFAEFYSLYKQATTGDINISKLKLHSLAPQY